MTTRLSILRHRVELYRNEVKYYFAIIIKFVRSTSYVGFILRSLEGFHSLGISLTSSS